MAEIELRHIDKHFGQLHVISDVNLTVKDREFVVLLGPSGCGKTTTLRAIAGLEEIDSGDITSTADGAEPAPPTATSPSSSSSTPSIRTSPSTRTSPS